MEYLYYKDKNGNFGDDLNGWLWPKIFGAENKGDNTCFLGIGTILYNTNDFLKSIDQKKKIVFGSGIRPTYSNFQIDNTWDIKFLRGPLSSNSLNNQFPFITDAAYALNQISDIKNIMGVPKKYEIGFMPYFKSMPYFDWKKICDQLGFHYISPFSENGVEFTMKEIAASKYIIAEAMHGAIVADILRVPWHRFVLSTPFTEGGMVSEFKWMDWLYSVDIMSADASFVKLYKKSSLHKLIDSVTFKMMHSQFFLKGIVKNEILRELESVKNFSLSRDSTIERVNNQIHDQIQKVSLQVVR